MKLNAMQEIWKNIEGLEGYYQVSNYGRIKMLSHDVVYRDGRKYHYDENILKTTSDAYGYKTFTASINRRLKRVKVHRAVALAFIPNPNQNLLKEVNHINGIKSDNHVINLEWVTSSENKKHAFRNGLTNPSLNLKNRKVKKGIDCSHSRKVTATKDGNVISFSPICQAKSAGFTLCKIYTALKTGKSYNGYHWSYAEK